MNIAAPKLHTETHESGITEIVMPKAQGADNDLLVMPMLAHLSQQCADEWFTWIAPRNFSKSILDRYEFARDKVRMVHTKDDAVSLWVFWSSLTNGNSGTVVASLEWLSEKDRKLLENASLIGKTRGVVLRYR